MVRVSTLFLAASAIGSSFVSALGVPASAIEARDSEAVTIDFVKHINVYWNEVELPQGIVAADADLNLGGILVQATLDGFIANATNAGVVELSLNYNFPSPGLVVPPLTTVNTGRIQNVKANPDINLHATSINLQADQCSDRFWSWWSRSPFQRGATI